MGRVDSSEERNNGLFHMAAPCEEPVKLASRGKNSSERRDKAKCLSACRIREEGSGWEGIRAREREREREEKKENKAAKQCWSFASRLCGLCVPGFRKRSTPRKGTNTTRTL